MSETLPRTLNQELETLQERRWDLVDELGALNLAIAGIMNRIKNEQLGKEEDGKQYSA